MTVTKESLRSAFEWIGPPPVIDTLDVGTGMRRTIENAARFTERLLPGECKACTGIIPERPCKYCGDTQQLWDEGLVEVVAGAILTTRYAGVEDAARAVLAALAQEVGKT